MILRTLLTLFALLTFRFPIKLSEPFLPKIVDLTDRPTLQQVALAVGLLVLLVGLHHDKHRFAVMPIMRRILRMPIALAGVPD